MSVDVGIPSGGGIGDVLGNIGDVLETVAAVGLELAPIALQMYQAINSDYINNWGYSMQEKGYLENIFNIYIIFEKL